MGFAGRHGVDEGLDAGALQCERYPPAVPRADDAVRDDCEGLRPALAGEQVAKVIQHAISDDNVVAGSHGRLWRSLHMDASVLGNIDFCKDAGHLLRSVLGCVDTVVHLCIRRRALPQQFSDALLHGLAVGDRA